MPAHRHLYLFLYSDGECYEDNIIFMCFHDRIAIILNNDALQSIPSIEYTFGDVHGECMADYASLDLRNIPWNDIKYKNCPGYEIIKSSHTRRVIRFTFMPKNSIPEVVLYAKRMRIRSLKRTFGSIFVSSKACREWILGHKLRAMNIITPLPVIYAERHKGLALQESFLVVTAIEDMCSLYERYQKCPDDALKQRLLCAGAAFLASLHSHGIYHDDFCTEHIFVPLADTAIRNDAFGIIDLDNARIYSRPVPIWKRAMNVFQFLRSIRMLSLEQRHTFIYDYFQAAAMGKQASRICLKLVNLIARLKKEEPIF